MAAPHSPSRIQRAAGFASLLLALIVMVLVGLGTATMDCAALSRRSQFCPDSVDGPVYIPAKFWHPPKVNRALSIPESDDSPRVTFSEDGRRLPTFRLYDDGRWLRSELLTGGERAGRLSPHDTAVFLEACAALDLSSPIAPRDSSQVDTNVYRACRRQQSGWWCTNLNSMVARVYSPDSSFSRFERVSVTDGMEVPPAFARVRTLISEWDAADDEEVFERWLLRVTVEQDANSRDVRPDITRLPWPSQIAVDLSAYRYESPPEVSALAAQSLNRDASDLYLQDGAYFVVRPYAIVAGEEQLFRLSAAFAEFRNAPVDWNRIPGYYKRPDWVEQLLRLLPTQR